MGVVSSSRHYQIPNNKEYNKKKMIQEKNKIEKKKDQEWMASDKVGQKR